MQTRLKWGRQGAALQLLRFSPCSSEFPGLGNWAVVFCEVWWTISHTPNPAGP